MFSSPVYFSWSGLPTGVSVSLTKPALPAPGDGATTTTFIAAASTTPGTYTATLTAIGGTLTQTVPVALTIRPAPSCSLTVNYPASPMVITAGQSSTIPVTCSGVQGSFNAPLSVSLTGSLSGVTAKLSAPTIAAGGSLTVQLTTLQSVSTSTLSLSLTASGSGFTKTVPISATVNASSFTVTAAQAAMTIKQASSGQVSLATAHIGVFNSPVSFSWSGLPAGVAASLSQAATPAPGDGTATTTFSVASSAKLGKYTATLIATGGGQTKTFPVAMTIAAK
jgi:PKD repeat protein